MTDRVPPEQIEALVGARRHPIEHIGNAVSFTETVFILHSQACKDTWVDLRECPFSTALDTHGIDVDRWPLDEPVELYVVNGYLRHRVRRT